MRSPAAGRARDARAATILALIAVEDPTWARDVAPVLFEHCATCHRPGEAAPFSLLTADDAADHARQIAEVTRSRYMPPWLAEPGDPPFVGERLLTDDEVATLSRWAEAGAPAGDLSRAPEPPEFSPGWRLGTPDLVLTMAEPFIVPADGIDLYRNFVLPVPDGAMKYVRGVDLRPGNPRVVHHAAVKLDRSDGSRRLDAADPLPGFEEMGRGDARPPDGHFVGWTPGRTPQFLPEGMSWRLSPGSDLVLQLHMLPSGKPEPVQASLGLFFTDVPPARVPFVLRLGSKALDIPAGARDHEVLDRFTLPVDVELHALAPHAHFLGRSVRCWATRPDGERRELLEIREWDFAWQDEFRYATPVRLTRGTTLEMQWTYDNSSDNPRNPRESPERVRYGPSSLEEMCDLWIQVVTVDDAGFQPLRTEFVRKDLALRRVGLEMELAHEPDDPDARLEFGIVLLQQGDAAGARRELERAVELAPDRAQARHQLGSLLALDRDPAGARAQFLRVLALEPDHVGTLIQLGILAEGAGDLEEAHGWYRRAVASGPSNFAARADLGRSLVRRGEEHDAAEQYEAALAIDPASNEVRRALAWLLATSLSDDARDGPRALSLARALVAEKPGDPIGLDVLAAAQAECGRFKAAVDTATRAAETARRRGSLALAIRIESRRDLYARSQAWRDRAYEPDENR